MPFRAAFAAARGGTPFSIELLVTVASAGALAIGAVGEAALVVLLFAIGELLENVAAGQARAGIRALVSLIPRTARREAAGGAVEEVPAASLRVGDVVRVRPGDRLPCDGEIVDGRSSLDESPVTGESVPVDGRVKVRDLGEVHLRTAVDIGIRKFHPDLRAVVGATSVYTF